MIYLPGDRFYIVDKKPPTPYFPMHPPKRGGSRDTRLKP